jgi:hypothetical protein
MISSAKQIFLQKRGRFHLFTPSTYCEGQIPDCGRTDNFAFVIFGLWEAIRFSLKQQIE